MIDGPGVSCEIALRWLSLGLGDEKSILLQVMAWYRQAVSHYHGCWWPGGTRSQVITDMASTHLHLDKMAAILADDIFKWIFLNENGRIPIQI